MKKRNFSRIGKPLLALALLVFVTVALMVTASADDLEWNLLTDKDAGYELKKFGGFEQTIDEDGAAMVHNTDTHKQGAFYIYDEKNILGSYRTFSLEGDFYFEAFPSGIRRDGELESTPKDKPLSFLCWSYRMINGGTQFFNALRIDDDGRLYLPKGYNTEKSDVVLEKEMWYNIRIVFTPLNGVCELFLNGESVASFTIIRFDPNVYVSNFIRYFDGYYDWGVKMKNILVKTDSDYVVGLRDEETANYVGYQTSMPENDTFTLRPLFGINTTDYNRVGYEVIKIYIDDDGEIFAEPISNRAKVVYESVKDAAGNVYHATEQFGYNYVAALEIPDLPAVPEFSFLELVIRPYVLQQNGMRMYGTSTILVHTGEVDENGYPTLIEKDENIIKVSPTDDTFAYTGLQHGNSVFGTNATLQMKNRDPKNIAPERACYFKFTLTPEQAKLIESAVAARFCVYVKDTQPNYDLVVHGTTADWDEKTLTANNVAQLAKTQEEIYQGTAQKSQFFYIDVLQYLQEAMLNEDGSMTVSFRVTNTGADDTVLSYLVSKEGAANQRPFLEIVNTVYEQDMNFMKISNNGYEPWGYAEYLVDNWFDELKDEIYKKDENGNLIEYEVNENAPFGYNEKQPMGDFTEELPWYPSFVWTSNGGVKEDSLWQQNKFARTLSTLGTSTANAYLDSEYAKTTTEYDVYGGIANAGFKGKETGFFHSEIIGGRTYFIDPLGNPFFIMAMNELKISNRSFVLDYLGSEEAFFEDSTRKLQAMGINTVTMSSTPDVLAVEDGLSVIIPLSGISQYMVTVGSTAIKEGTYPDNNTINFFDPDFIKWANKTMPATIEENGYADNPRVIGYTADNELPSGTDMLYRYLTIDTDSNTGAFSYAVAWTFLAKKMNTLTPSLNEYLNSPDMAAINSEFMSFAFATYYKAIRDAINLADENHMYFGSRANLACRTDPGYLRAAGQYLDAITTNIYGGLYYDWDMMVNFYRYSGKPFLVTEFFAKSMDAIDDHGFTMGNSVGAGFAVKTQQDRADFYEHHALACIESKACVGWTWYRMIDNDPPLLHSINLDIDVVMAYVNFNISPAVPLTFIDIDGNIYTDKEVGKYDIIDSGDALMSNLNVNKGVFNRNYTSTVCVYSYNKDGKLLGTKSYHVEHPDSYDLEDGTVLMALAEDDTATFTLGKKVNSDGSYTVTELTTYRGVYIKLASAMRKVSDNLIGVINFFDAQ